MEELNIMCVPDWELIGDFLSPILITIIVIWFANNRIGKSVLSNQKLRWVEELRNTISSFISVCDQYQTTHRNLSDTVLHEIIDEELKTEIIGKLEKEKRTQKDEIFILRKPLVKEAKLLPIKYKNLGIAYDPYLKSNGDFLLNYGKLKLLLDIKNTDHNQILNLLKEFKRAFDEAEKNLTQEGGATIHKFLEEKILRLEEATEKVIQLEKENIKTILKIFSLDRKNKS